MKRVRRPIVTSGSKNLWGDNYSKAKLKSQSKKKRRKNKTYNKITKEFIEALPEMNQLIEKQLLYIDDEKNFKSKTSRKIFFQNQTYINKKAHSGKMYPLDLLFEENVVFQIALQRKQLFYLTFYYLFFVFHYCCILERILCLCLVH